MTLREQMENVLDNHCGIRSNVSQFQEARRRLVDDLLRCVPQPRREDLEVKLHRAIKPLWFKYVLSMDALLEAINLATAIAFRWATTPASEESKPTEAVATPPTPGTIQGLPQHPRCFGCGHCMNCSTCDSRPRTEA